MFLKTTKDTGGKGTRLNENGVKEKGNWVRFPPLKNIKLVEWSIETR